MTTGRRSRPPVRGRCAPAEWVRLAPVEGGASAPPPQPPGPRGAGSRPTLTVPQLLAFGAFGLLSLLALFAADGAAVTSKELSEMGTLTMFLIGALLPSDALIRFGRNILFQSVDDPDAAAKASPATTLAQLLGFATFVLVMALTFFPQVSAEEFEQINEAARVLIIALLPSDAGIRFGRALYFRSDATPQPGAAHFRRM